MDSSAGYHGCDSQTGAIRRIIDPSSQTFLRTLLIRTNGGKAYPFHPIHGICRVSVPTANGLGLQLTN